MSEPVFHEVAAMGDFEPEEGLLRIVNGVAVALFRVGDSVYAINDRCTHGDASLADGWLDGCEIECPLHQGRFDVSTGEATAAPCVVPVATYPVQIKDERVFVAVPD